MNNLSSPSSPRTNTEVTATTGFVNAIRNRRSREIMTLRCLEGQSEEQIKNQGFTQKEIQRAERIVEQMIQIREENLNRPGFLTMP